MNSDRRVRIIVYSIFLLIVTILVWFIWFKEEKLSRGGLKFKSFSTFRLPDRASAYLLCVDNRTGKEGRVEIGAKKPGELIGLGVIDREGTIEEDMEELRWEGLTVPDNEVTEGLKAGQVIDSHLRIIDIDDHKVIRSRFNFFYQCYDHPTLKLLRQREGLDKVIAGEEEELPEFIKLMHWVHGQWEAGSPDPYPSWNAVLILDMIREGETGGFCAQYAQVLVQSLLSLGYQARYVSPENHVAVEVWSNQYQKWVVLDPYLDIYYQHKGIPLNAWEVYRKVKMKEIDSIEMVGDISCDLAGDYISQYRRFRVHFKNNHLSVEQSPARDLEEFSKSGVILLDEYTEKLPFENGKVPLITSRLDDLYFNLNMVEVKKIESLSDSTYQISFDTFTPEFDVYLITVDEDKEKRYEITGGFKWELREGKNRMEVRARNKAGILGSVSSIIIEYKSEG